MLIYIPFLKRQQERPKKRASVDQVVSESTVVSCEKKSPAPEKRNASAVDSIEKSSNPSSKEADLHKLVKR